MAGSAEVVVVGAGPAGVSAALTARELGADVTLLEAGQVGGTSLNRGPAPVRTLARAARLARDWSSWAGFGLEGPPPKPNLPAVLANSARVARYAHEKKQLSATLRRQGIDLVEHIGPVHFSDPHSLCAHDGRTWQAQCVIVAVGGHAARLPVPGQELAVTYEDVPSLAELPKSAAIIGAADTGCQIASILADFGVEVTLYEAGPTIVPRADASISTELRNAFNRKGITTRPDTLVTELERRGRRIAVHHRNAASAADTVADETIVDAVFFAVGWPGNIDQLSLESAGITPVRHAIPVDAYLRTEADHIFAAGDINGRAMLVQVARIEGRIAAHNAVLGPSREVAYGIVPSASFTDPEYGQVGLTEEAAAQDHDIVVGIAHYDDILRPVADGRPDGFCKLIADRRQRTLLGGHVIGEYSAEIIQVVATCMVSGMSVDKVAELPFAYPTFTEAVSMAAQKICRSLDIGQFPAAWSYLGPDA
jgi:pyruvate/2-oxoglutarate dehydrogenase complex dihydrolipoamide dehydrogenase (E3) component